MSTMSADEVRELGDTMIASLVGVLGAVGLVNEAVAAEILGTDQAQANAQRPQTYPNLLTVEQAAERLGATVADVQWMYLRDGLHYIHIGAHGDDEDSLSIVRIHPGDLDAYIASRRVKTS